MAAQMLLPAGGEDLGISPPAVVRPGSPDSPSWRMARSPPADVHLPLGRVGEDSLREIWAASPVLAQLRDRSQYHGKCGSCKRWSACRGCRAIAYAYAQSQGTPIFWPPIPVLY